jgi:Fic family protein
MTSNIDGNWPRIQSVQVKWLRDESHASSRRQALRQRGPYLAAVVPLIAHQNPILTPEIQALAEEAALELARFDTEVGQMVAPFAAMLLRSEAASSSQIENLTSTVGSILKAEFGFGESPNSSLIVSNQRAMEAAIEASTNLSLTSILNMHRILMAKTDPENAGRLRKEAVWIGGSNLGPHGADYVGPEADAVPELIHDLVIFCNRLDLPAFVQVAIAHAQFETIHPFTDGNGRTGRALVQALLHRLGVTSNVAVPVSAGLLKDTARYFAALGSYRSGDVSAIIQVFSEAAISAVENGRTLAIELRDAQVEWRNKVSARTGSGASILLTHLLQQPVLNRQRVIDLLGTTPANAQLAIDKLVEAGVLTQIGDGKRNRIWQATDVVAALNSFAHRIKRE